MKCFLLALACSISVSAANPAATAARNWREAHEQAILREFTTLLAVPNLASDRDGIQANAKLITEMLQRRGVDTRMLLHEGAPPVIFGEIRTPGAQRTIVFYAHYDGQPLNPTEWATPPWEPGVRDAPLD